jgi:maltose/moltooligosaccharide transporter
MKLNYGKTFLLGFGFFGVSVIWGVYNAFVPLFLANKFELAPVWIGFFMTLDNIAALLIQPPVGAWGSCLWFDPPGCNLTAVCGLHQHPAA